MKDTIQLLKDYINIVNIKETKINELDQNLLCFLENSNPKEISIEMLQNLRIHGDISVKVKKTVHRLLTENQSAMDPINFNIDVSKSREVISNYLEELNEIATEFNNILSDYVFLLGESKKLASETIKELSELFINNSNDVLKKLFEDILSRRSNRPE